MSAAKPKPAPQFARQLLQELLAQRQTAGDIEDLLKDLRKAFIEHALGRGVDPSSGLRETRGGRTPHGQLAQRLDAQNDSHGRSRGHDSGAA